jgi:probable F420-dependent oxidoreductase
MSIGVGLGLMESPFADARGFWRWIDLCEQGGIDSVWQTDRIVSSIRMLETMSVMAALAGATKRLKFGMNVASVGLREPVLLAKQCATIDFLSEGRLLPAFGIGNVRAADWDGVGLSQEGRGKRTNEGLEIIARLWKGETFDYAGEFYTLKGAVISPLPVQKKLPLWLGGSSVPAIRRTARYGTGWVAGPETPDLAGETISAIKAALVEENRSIDHDHYGANMAFRFGSWDDAPVQRTAEAHEKRTGRDPRKSLVVGGSEEIMQRLGEYVAAGVSKFVLRPMSTDDEDMLAQTRRFIEETQPLIGGLEEAT